jgi:hypothetical protein
LFFNKYGLIGLLILGFVGGVGLGVLVVGPADAGFCNSNYFDGGSTWFTGGTLTTDQAYSATHSVVFAAGNAVREYQPFADMPTLGANQEFSSFNFSIRVNDLNNATQSYQLAVKFAKADNTGEEPTDYYRTNYTAVSSGFGKLTLTFTGTANAEYLTGHTRISRAYIRAYNSGTYVPYYVDDASFDYTIVTVPEPASMAMLGLGGLMLLQRRRRQGRA